MLMLVSGVGLARMCSESVCRSGGKYDRIMSLLELGPVIFGGVEGIKTYLRYHQLLATQKNCSRCGISMREGSREDISDKTSWWCPQCKTRKSIRDGSFFAKSRLTLQKWLLILYMW